MTTTITAPQSCPKCKYRLEAHTPVESDNDYTPEEGSLSVCLNCGEILTFDADLKLRKTTQEELIELKENDNESYQLITKASYVIKEKEPLKKK